MSEQLGIGRIQILKFVLQSGQDAVMPLLVGAFTWSDKHLEQ